MRTGTSFFGLNLWGVSDTMNIRTLYLRRDMIPIFVDPEGGEHSAHFKSPIPQCHNKVIEQVDSDELKEHVFELAEMINEKIRNYEEPFDRFDNIYDVENRTLIAKRRLMIREDDGLTGIWIGNSANTGDIYRNTGSTHFLNMPHQIQNIIHDKEAWFCHNIDHYLQAVATREMTIEYFNYVLNRANELDIDIKGDGE